MKKLSEDIFFNEYEVADFKEKYGVEYLGQIWIERSCDHMPFDRDGKHATGFCGTWMYICRNWEGTLPYGKGPYGALFPFDDPRVVWEYTYED